MSVPQFHHLALFPIIIYNYLKMQFLSLQVVYENTETISNIILNAINNTELSSRVNLFWSDYKGPSLSEGSQDRLPSRRKKNEVFLATPTL